MLNKKGKIKLLVLASITILVTMLFFLSADALPNKIDYSNNDLDVSIKTSLDVDLGTISLKSHPSVDYIKYVSPGEQVVMWYDFNFIDSYSRGLGEVTFIDLNTDKEITKSYSFVKWVEKVCSSPITLENGTTQQDCTPGYWEDYNSLDIPKGEIRIGLKVQALPGEHIDGIWEIAGKKIDKHAEWIILDVEDWNYNGLSGDTGDLILTAYCNTSYGAVKSIGIIRTYGNLASTYNVYVNKSDGTNIATTQINIEGEDSDIEFGNFSIENYSEMLNDGDKFTIEFHNISGNVSIGYTANTDYSGTYFSLYGQSWTWGDTRPIISFWNLTITNPPSIPELSYPSNGSGFLYDSVINFSWINSTDSEGDTITYNLEIYNNSDMASENLIYSNTSIPEGTSPTLITINLSGNISLGNKYYWRVRSKDAISSSNWSNTFEFYYALWNVTFNLTDSFTGEEIDTGPSNYDIYSISCNNGYESDTLIENPHPVSNFGSGIVECTFIMEGGQYLINIMNVTADYEGKIIEIPMSESKGLTEEEHDWLEAVYECLIKGTGCA